MEADFLAKTASVDEMVSDQIKVQYIPSIDILEVHQIDGVANWTTPIVSYLKDRLLLEDKEEARKLRVRAMRFVLMDEVLYKRGDGKDKYGSSLSGPPYNVGYHNNWAYIYSCIVLFMDNPSIL